VPSSPPENPWLVAQGVTLSRAYAQVSAAPPQRAKRSAIAWIPRRDGRARPAEAKRVLSNGLIDKIVLSDDSLMAIFDGFYTVLALRTAWWQAPDNLVRAWRSCPETRSGLNDLTGTEFVL
jgi:hypothetical protein